MTTVTSQALNNSYKKKDAGRGASSDGFRKQAEMMQTWRGTARHIKKLLHKWEDLHRTDSYKKKNKINVPKKTLIHGVGVIIFNVTI